MKHAQLPRLYMPFPFLLSNRPFAVPPTPRPDFHDRVCRLPDSYLSAEDNHPAGRPGWLRGRLPHPLQRNTLHSLSI